MTNDVFVDRLTALVEEKIEKERDREESLIGNTRVKGQRRFNLQNIAKELNITYSTLSGYVKSEIDNEKKNDKFPSGKTLIELANYFEVTVDYLLGLSNAKTRDINEAAIGDYTGLSIEAIRFLHHGQKRRNESFEINEEIDSFKNTIEAINALLNYSDLMHAIENVVFQTDSAYHRLDQLKKEINNQNPDHKMKYNQRLFLFACRDQARDNLNIALYNTVRELHEYFEKNFGTTTALKGLEHFFDDEKDE